MYNKARKVAILGGVRTPFAKSFTSYTRVRTKDLITATLKELVKKFKLENEKLGDVATGAVMKSSSDWNLTREAVLGSGLHPYTPGYDVQRACGTGLETAWQIALKISAGHIENGIAGGVDTNSDLPVSFSNEFAWKLLDLNKAKSFGEKLKVFLQMKPSDLKPVVPGVVEPRTNLSMGQHTEKMVKEWGITRAEQDELSAISHKNAAKAYAEGFYDDLVFEFNGVKKDNVLREDTTVEKLAKLKPAFDRSEKGTLTAGNSSALTDGASAVLLSSEEYAQKKGIPVLAYLKDVEVAAINFTFDEGKDSGGDGLLMAPTIAVGELLKRNNLKLQDFDFYEIHEAFAGQVLCTLKAWESNEYCQKYLKSEALGPIDRSKMNVKGGSVALGHLFAATGGRIIASLAKIIAKNGRGRGLISICTAGGMGIAAIVEK